MGGSKEIMQGSWLGWGGGELSIGQKKMTSTLLSTKVLYRKSSEQQCRTTESTFLKLVYMSNVINRLMEIHTSSTLMRLCIWNTKSRTFFLSNFINYSNYWLCIYLVSSSHKVSYGTISLRILNTYFDFFFFFTTLFFFNSL